MVKTHVSILFLSLLLVGCSLFETLNPKPELPETTTNGANTFGALVNRKVWEIRNSFRMRSHYLNSEYISISGNYRSKEIDQHLIIQISNEPIAEGDYVFNKSLYLDRLLSWADDKLDQYFSGDDPNVTFNGTLTIFKLDRSNKIVSGTFEFQIHKAGEATVNIGNGRFDMIYGQ
ncbi:hypothetical protein [Roseivirga spongicola]|uniref:hypothetical protein n=1 Tax=Roseivirga spongicola TaxID=333140 RepID=UPI002AC986C6|nr:hypothetical protein [Roseivirga spongicola]WPZ08571.1 hypothetical protein T7867_09885 [Roseivirga spongicola]